MEQARRSPIGTRRDAAAALARCIAESPRYTDPYDKEPVNGLRYCGQGVDRAVYVDARERFVYKVDSYRAQRPEYDYSSNDVEYQNCLKLREEGLPWAPPAYVWNIDGHSVLAMPFYPVSGKDAPTRQRIKARALEYGDWRPYLGDLHDGNWRLTKNGQIRVIDLA